MSQAIPIIMQVRQQSERCPNKVLRPFYENLSLTELMVSQFENRKDVYLVGYEREDFEPIAKRHGVNFLQRSRESALSEDGRVIQSYLKDFPTRQVCMVNVCTPLLRAETIDAAIAECERLSAPVMVPIIETKEIILSAEHHPVNPDATLFNSKLRKPLYQIVNNFVIHTPTYTLEHGRYFETYQPGHPAFFTIPYRETIDIDTEDQFIIAQVAYQRYRQLNAEL